MSFKPLIHRLCSYACDVMVECRIVINMQNFAIMKLVPDIPLLHKQIRIIYITVTADY